MVLTDILPTLRQWVSGVSIPAQIQKDSADGLWVIFETENALAELLVGAPDCAPYRSVLFTVVDIRRDVTAEPVFCFYDDESHTIADILRELDRGLELFSAL